MPPRSILPTSTPDIPNLWLTASASTLREARTEEAKAKAREEQRSATTKGHVYEMLGEINNLPISIPADPEHRDVSGIPTKTEKRFDWPNDLIDRIKQVMGMPCSTPSAPEFKFEISEEAMQQYLAALEKYEFNVGKAFDAQHDSPLGSGMEFCPPDVLRSISGLHPLWNQMEDILQNGSNWLFEEISEKDRASNLQEALIFGNHKGASSKPDLLKKRISKDVRYGYSLLIPLDSMMQIKVKGLEMASNEHYGAEYVQQIWRSHPKR